MDVDSLRLALQTLSLTGTVAWLALAGLCLHLWRRERAGWYGRLGIGFLLLGLNPLLAGVLAWLLAPVYDAFATSFDVYGQEGTLLNSIASSGLALIAIILIGLGLAASVRKPAATGKAARRGERRPGREAR